MGSNRFQLFTEPAQSALHEQTRRNLEKVVKGLGARFGLQEVGVHVWGPRLSFDHPEYVIVVGSKLKLSQNLNNNNQTRPGYQVSEWTSTRCETFDNAQSL